MSVPKHHFVKPGIKGRLIIRNLLNGKSSIHIVEASVTLAHKLDMSVVAEGVETKEIYDYLKLNKCNFIQGYYISRPLVIADFDDWHADFKASNDLG